MTLSTVRVKSVLPLAAAVALMACDDGAGPAPGAFRFGQVGHIRATLLVPLAGDAGELAQTLVWESSGAWELTERISYQGVPGGEHVRSNPGDPAAYASAYAGMITQINQTEGLELFTDYLDPDLVPTCGPTRTTVILSVQDDTRGERETWVRCSSGDFGNLPVAASGPDPAASRVIQVADLAGQFTLGDGFVSVYFGSVPFASIDQGEDSRAHLEASFTFASEFGWPEFWRAHAGRDVSPPEVDFERDIVIVGAVGLRFEAGARVEVRRILQVEGGTFAEVVERVPGDFCAPAERLHVPFHIVLAPRTQLPVRFPEPKVERVPCG